MCVNAPPAFATPLASRPRLLYSHWQNHIASSNSLNYQQSQVFLAFCWRVLLLLLYHWKDFKTFRQSVRKIWLGWEFDCYRL